MDSIIKKYADSGEVEHLRYIFLDSLDVDPTFENYKEELEYCRNIPGLFEPYKEMSPLKKDPSEWNDSYWISIKKDLKKNYSIERFEHMKEVAKVVYADKIERLKAERKARADEAAQKEKEQANAAEIARQAEERRIKAEIDNKKMAAQKADEQRKAEEKRKADERQSAAAQNERVRKAEEDKKRRDEELAAKNAAQRDASLKKALGAAAVITIVVLVVLIVLAIK